MRSMLFLCLFSTMMSSSTTAQAAVRHRHVPPAEAHPRQPLALTVSLDRGWDMDMELHFRALGTDEWLVASFGRSQEETYTATIPADQVQPPGLEYFIVSRNQGRLEGSIFASTLYPHRVRVEEEPGVILRERILAHHRNHRAGIRISGEWVDSDGETGPSYKRIDGSVNYLLLALPLKTIRFGYAHQFGDGEHRASWFVLGLAHSDALELDVGAALAMDDDPTGGGRAELRIGVEQGTHIALGGEYIRKVHSVGRFRLAWATVPGFSMAASVEMGSYPSESESDNDNEGQSENDHFGVRLIYDLTRTFDNGFIGGLRISYQGDSQLTGGVSVGYEF